MVKDTRGQPRRKRLGVWSLRNQMPSYGKGGDNQNKGGGGQQGRPSKISGIRKKKLEEKRHISASPWRSGLPCTNVVEVVERN